jgi:hypothetical protein
MAINEDQILIREANSNQFTIIKSWGKMKWSKKEQMLYGPKTAELLNKLSTLVRLPAPIEAERYRLNMITRAVDRERIRAEPVPLYKYPVKLPLYKHQVRGVNMALLTFGFIDPPEVCDAES